MEHLELKLSDGFMQQKLETIIAQLGYTITGRTVSEMREQPPLLRYRLTGAGDANVLLETIPRIGYGLTREPMQKKTGKRTTLHLTIRQLAPTDTSRQGGLKTFGDGQE